MSGSAGDTGRRWHCNQKILFRSLVDGGILYDESSGQVHHLNRTAAHVWSGCAEGATIRELVAGFCEHYAVTEEKAAEDVTRILHELDAAGALV